MERHASMSSLPDGSEGGSHASLERHATGELSFFTPSSISFNPRPYFPHTGNAPARARPTPSTSLQREPSASALLQRSLDVSYSDPDVTFIRYPFTDFPDADLYPDGLTYNVMADHPNWFLDPADFTTENDNDLNRVPYPQALEPPRGWCPLKKKDIKEKGPEAFNGDDAPKLRCTFCRRGYAGVNAKSMWRRHVLEKHKIPMSNRRDGPNEGSSRSRSHSNKENKRSVSTSSIPTKKDGFTIQTFFKPKGKESISAPVPSNKATSGSGSTRNRKDRADSPNPMLTDDVPTDTEATEEHSEGTKRSEPQFAPDDGLGSSSSFYSPQLASSMLPPSSPLDEGISHLSYLDLSPPRNTPTKTPNVVKKRGHFRMPWKFPSPSHPLYNGPDELCLGVPIKGMAGEGLRSSYVPIETSPLPGAGDNRSQFSSPAASSPLNQRPVTGKVLGWKKPKGLPKSKLPPLPEPSPKRPAYTGPLPVPMSDSLELEPTPDLTFSTDTDPDNSISTLEEPFSSWFEFSSPLNRRKDSGILDTPLRRSTSFASIDKLQLVPSEKDREDGKKETSSKLLPSGLGLALNFKINMSLSGTKRARSEERDEDDSSDEFGELHYPSADDTEYPKPAKPTGHKSKSSSISSLFGDTSSTEREDAPPTTDHESDESDSVFRESVPRKKRRLLC